MTPGYIKSLTQEERAGCIKLGALLAFAHVGVVPSKIDSTVKAAGLSDYLNTAGKAVIAISLIGGIPIGVAAHIVNRRINEQSIKEKEMQERLKYYRSATGSLETGLADMNS